MSRSEEITRLKLSILDKALRNLSTHSDTTINQRAIIITALEIVSSMDTGLKSYLCTFSGVFNHCLSFKSGLCSSSDFCHNRIEID